MAITPGSCSSPLFGTVEATALLDRFYYAWFPLGFVFVVWMAWSRRRELRLRFFLTFLLTWIVLGTVLATMFSSVGPCYYGRVVGSPDPFVPLMAFRREVDEIRPLRALEIQEYLWDAYSGHADRFLEGISAMPSLHVAMPALYTLVAFHVHRWMGTAFALYALLVLLGSVHLGWHYAVDGYASVLLVVLGWYAVGPPVRRHLRWVRRKEHVAALPGEPADEGARP